jgi:hypothetical protein
MSDKHPGPLEQLPDLFAHFLAELQAELATSSNGIRDTGARYVPVRPNGSTVASTSPGALVGWSFRETAGAVAQLELRDGDTRDSGALIASISLAANESKVQTFMPSGIGFGRGLVFVVVAGNVEGSVFFRAVE